MDVHPLKHSSGYGVDQCQTPPMAVDFEVTKASLSTIQYVLPITPWEFQKCALHLWWPGCLRFQACRLRSSAWITSKQWPTMTSHWWWYVMIDIGDPKSSSPPFHGQRSQSCHDPGQSFNTSLLMTYTIYHNNNNNNHNNNNSNDNTNNIYIYNMLCEAALQVPTLRHQQCVDHRW